MAKFVMLIQAYAKIIHSIYKKPGSIVFITYDIECNMRIF